MNLLLIAMLGGLWAAILLTGVLGDRRPRSPLASVDSFERLMDTLAPLQQMPPADPQGTTTARRPPAPPPVPARRLALRRRKQVFRTLVAAVPGTAAIGLLFGGWAWLLPLLALLALLAYCALLVRLRHQSDLRARVRVLLQRADAEADAIAERDTVRRAGEA
jgi:hypothetical protein